jgi:hypothetical protein
MIDNYWLRHFVGLKMSFCQTKYAKCRTKSVFSRTKNAFCRIKLHLQVKTKKRKTLIRALMNIAYRRPLPKALMNIVYQQPLRRAHLEVIQNAFLVRQIAFFPTKCNLVRHL